MIAKKVCIIDDEPLLCDILKDYLSASFEVDVYSDPLAFFEVVESTNYDLYLCDVKMPYYDGVEILNLVSEKHKNKQFVFMSGSISLGKEFMNLIDNENVYFLSKPFDSLEEVDGLLQNLLLA